MRPSLCDEAASCEDLPEGPVCTCGYGYIGNGTAGNCQGMEKRNEWEEGEDMTQLKLF